ncbi:MAG: NADH-quinone oxidoreductase subunit L [Gemmatimonadetes bacterium]|nr:NADH-quinone oxidoreductase subunit L [Gemmatimonadota bacterium]
MLTAALICLLVPLAAFVVQLFLGTRLPRGGDFVSVGAIGASLLAACWIFWQVMAGGEPGYQWSMVFRWVEVEGFTIPMGLAIDTLTAWMLLVVVGVSFLVHVFSIGYMHGEDRYHLYFGYLSLFSFSMLWLVLSDNLLGIFVGWELVGVSSYLLIGFFFPKRSAALACKKAFLTNRVGDLGMWLGIMLVWKELGVLRLEQVYHHVGAGAFSSEATLTIAGVLLFVGAVGKSAQLPLHVWLPDAMEGPTPVSALIHAATMVAAGVYLVGRLFPILTPDALLVIAYVGALTAFFAATIAIVQDDIKRVLAYSTVSQLGYMMVGLGVGSYFGGLFHLTTHAAFKACLFLGSGSVIHAVHTQNIWEMGGLRKKMPITFATWVISTAAISGFPVLTNGFFSKERILGDAMGFGLHLPQHFLIFALPMVAAVITVFYMTRVTIVTFFGEPRDREKYEHAHEGGFEITAPLMVLSAITLLGFAYAGPFERMVTPPSSTDYAAEQFAAFHYGESLRTGALDESHGAHAAEAGRGEAAHEEPAHAETGAEHHEAPWGPHRVDAHSLHTGHRAVLYLSLLALILGVALATLIYHRKRSQEALARRFSGTWRVLYNKYFVDEAYQAGVVNPLLWLNRLSAAFDRVVIDGAVNGSATLTRALSSGSGWSDLRIIDGIVNGIASVTQVFGAAFRRVETGRIQHYFAFFLAGTLVLMLIRVY